MNTLCGSEWETKTKKNKNKNKKINKKHWAKKKQKKRKVIIELLWQQANHSCCQPSLPKPMFNFI